MLFGFVGFLLFFILFMVREHLLEGKIFTHSVQQLSVGAAGWCNHLVSTLRVKDQ